MLLTKSVLNVLLNTSLTKVLVPWTVPMEPYFRKILLEEVTVKYVANNVKLVNINLIIVFNVLLNMLNLILNVSMFALEVLI